MSSPAEPCRPIRVLVVEDHPVVAEGLSSLLEDYPEVTVTGIASSVAEIIPVLETITADVAVVDYHLPDGTVYDAVDRIRSRSPFSSIVVISADEGDPPLLAAIRVGASGYLIKSATGEKIIQVIRAAAGGEIVIPESIRNRALAVYRESTRQQAGQARLESLTTREREVLAMMSHGADNRTVARRLQISYVTVRTHVRSILTKLGARSQLEAVAKAREWGFRG